MRTLLCSIVLFSVLVGCTTQQKRSFITVKENRFILHDSDYHFIGANYWYGSFIALSDSGQKRVVSELDFMKSQGVTNLRVIAAAEGEGEITGVLRVGPAYQPTAGNFNEKVLTGLDFVLAEMGKRNMHAVVYLTNNWEWSGGFLQYLQWNGKITDSVLRSKMNWDTMRDIVSMFYSCDPCVTQQQQVIKNIVGRTNSISGIKYSEDPTIMSWELANEPRPMRPAAISAYKEWIVSCGLLIKSLDGNHLLTTGVEGGIGTEGITTFTEIHQDKNIDYATIHIWPKNWSWYSDTSMAKGMDTVLQKTDSFLTAHMDVMKQINKPLVLEEFGMPRDQQLYTRSASTVNRDKYYQYIFNRLQQSITNNDVLRGANFWAMGGMGKPTYKQPLWITGNDFVGDPPMEPQGLYSVFDTDSSTWKIIRNSAMNLNKPGAK